MAGESRGYLLESSVTKFIQDERPFLKMKAVTDCSGIYFLKDQVYRKHPATLANLKDAIIRNVRGINVDLLHSAVEHTALLMERVMENDGTHIKHL